MLAKDLGTLIFHQHELLAAIFTYPEVRTDIGRGDHVFWIWEIATQRPKHMGLISAVIAAILAAEAHGVLRLVSDGGGVALILEEGSYESYCPLSQKINEVPGRIGLKDWLCRGGISYACFRSASSQGTQYMKQKERLFTSIDGLLHVETSQTSDSRRHLLDSMQQTILSHFS